MEKQEAGSLRQALQEKDRLEEEARIHTQAQDEAADLVWSHQNPQDPSLPFRNPDVDFKQHLKKGSHARSQSIGPFSSLYIKKGGSGSEGSRSASEGSNTSEGGVVASENAGSIQTTRGPGSEDREGRLARKSSGFSSIKNKYGSLKSTLSGPREMIRQRSSSAKGRKTSGESASAKSVFRNPEDQIYEEPENVTTTESSTVTKDSRALASTTRNTSYGSRSMKEKLDQRSQTDPVYNRVDIYKNTPTQSRNAAYQQNEFPVKIDLLPERPPTREGKEIRSDDIRSATSMKLKDRSEKLPMPTIVSNRPGRPIVSFKSAERELRQETSSRPSTRDGPSSKPLSSVKPSLAAVNSEPIIPTISLPDAPSIRVDEAPTIRLNDAPSVPTINVPDDTPSISVWEAPSIAITPDVAVVKTDPTSRPIHSSPRPLPRPGASARPPPANRPLPTHSSTAPVKSIPHWSPAAQLRRNQAQCAACALPISGRVVGAAGQRFHPQCFNCFQCGELLECVAFYPEPDKNRAERLDRIEARLQGQPIPDEQAHHTEASDGDESLRFFCHLDFHENFSPRCRSCKTPIEGEVIVACGGEWHAGHFFCAECGDPFDEKTPFVEKDGFAWCTGCHTRKHYGKCAGCKKPILDVVMKAMGLEWHEGCFVCCQCGGGFGDGRFFVREGEGLPVCVGCEERRLKA
jgi:paxillin